MKNALGWILLVAVAVGALWYAFFRAPKSTLISIGVSQISTDAAFDQMKAGLITGFKAAGYEQGKHITFDFENAGGSNNANLAIAQRFANGQYDILVPLGTPAARAVVNAISDRPVVFGSVADPVASGIVSSDGQSHKNVTGTSDTPLFLEQLTLLRRLVPSAKTVGVFYASDDPAAPAMLTALSERVAGLGLTLIITPVRSNADLVATVRNLIDQVDSVYVLPSPDHLLETTPIIQLALDHQKPFIALDQISVSRGALAAMTIDYSGLGQRTAELVVRILKGESPQNIPVVKVTDADMFLNTTTAEKIGLPLSSEITKEARQLYR